MCFQREDDHENRRIWWKEKCSQTVADFTVKAWCEDEFGIWFWTPCLCGTPWPSVTHESTSGPSCTSFNSNGLKGYRTFVRPQRCAACCTSQLWVLFLIKCGRAKKEKPQLSRRSRVEAGAAEDGASPTGGPSRGWTNYSHINGQLSQHGHLLFTLKTK